MRLRFPLYLQTLGMLILYLGTLLTIILLCFNAQFGIGWEAALNSPLGEKYETVAGAVSSQLHAAKPATWPEIIRAFEETYHVKFYVFDIRGNQIAGDTISLPTSVSSRIVPPPPAGFFLRAGGGPQAQREIFSPPPPGQPPGPPPPRSSQPDSPPSGLPPAEAPQLGSPPPGLQQPVPLLPGPPFDKPGQAPPPGDLIFSQKGPGPMPPLPPIAFVRARDRFMVHTSDPDRFWICAHIHVFSPKLGFYVPGTLVALSDNLWQSSLLLDLKVVGAFMAVVLGLSVIFWWPFIYRITSALSRLTAATESIAQGKFDTRVNAGGGDEIGRLSEAVDAMAAQLEGYVLEQKRLLADISHEMFSPLARLQLALELLDGGSSEEQQGHIADIREEVEEMNNLIAELIAYSKAGMQAKTAELTGLNLRDLVLALIPKLLNNNNIAVEVPENMTVMADRLLLERAISNVLRNSVRYAGPHGRIKVSALAEGTEVVITIADDGPGVSEASLKHLGQPFYRPEASRNRASGGFGLGLAIVKSCTTACQGSFALRNVDGGGLAVELRLQAGARAPEQK